MADGLYGRMKQTVIDGEVKEAAALAQQGLDAGLSPGDLFGKGELSLPELVQGAPRVPLFLRASQRLRTRSAEYEPSPSVLQRFEEGTPQ